MFGNCAYIQKLLTSCLGVYSGLIFAGHDTTSSILSRALHLLSMDQERQTRLREEVTAAREERGDLDYDSLMSLPLLDAVCRETLRLFPPLSSIGRMYVMSLDVSVRQLSLKTVE